METNAGETCSGVQWCRDDTIIDDTIIKVPLQFYNVKKPQT